MKQKTHEEEMAVQQFTGFGYCKKDVGIIELATSMGLTKSEFEHIQDEIEIYLPPAEFEELEIYFSKIKK